MSIWSSVVMGDNDRRAAHFSLPCGCPDKESGTRIEALQQLAFDCPGIRCFHLTPISLRILDGKMLTFRCTQPSPHHLTCVVNGFLKTTAFLSILSQRGNCLECFDEPRTEPRFRFDKNAADPRNSHHSIFPHMQ